MYEKYPLQWPAGYKKTPPVDRIESQFKQTMHTAQQFLNKEIERLNATDLIISTNIPVRKSDGGFYSEYSSKRLEDPGVSIYFKINGKDRSMCDDQYVYVWENIYALGKGLEALRGIERWGISDFLDRAFTGFPALPESSSLVQTRIWDVLWLSGQPASSDIIRKSYRRIARKVHPDQPGGSNDAFAELQEAYRQALQIFNETP